MQNSSQPSVLHALMGTIDLSVARLLPYGEVLVDPLAEVVKFHEREFPGCQLEIETARPLPEGLFFEDLRAKLEVGETPEWLKGTEDSSGCILIVALPQREPTPYSAGYGAPGLMVLGLVENDPFISTLIAHELYHALLDLPHTDGLEGPFDPDSVMGEEGRFGPLMDTHVCQEQVQHCFTIQAAQEAVERGDYDQALELDPRYCALYPLVVEECAREGVTKFPLILLRTWWELGHTPEAASHFAEFLLNIGSLDTARDILQDTLGYFEAANTHLYAARACVAARHYQLAIEELNMALNLAPDCLPALGALGWCYHRLGKERLARKFYLQALDQAPDWLLVQARLDWLDGKSYAAPTSDPELLYVQARCTEDTEAIEILQNVKDQTCLHYLGQLLAKAGRNEEAVSAFESAASVHRLNFEGKASLAWLAHLQDKPGAQELAETVRNIWPNDESCSELEG